MRNVVLWLKSRVWKTAMNLEIFKDIKDIRYKEYKIQNTKYKI